MQWSGDKTAYSTLFKSRIKSYLDAQYHLHPCSSHIMKPILATSAKPEAVNLTLTEDGAFSTTLLDLSTSVLSSNITQRPTSHVLSSSDTIHTSTIIPASTSSSLSHNNAPLDEALTTARKSNFMRSSTDTLLFPSVQMGAFHIHQDHVILSRVLDFVASKSHNVLFPLWKDFNWSLSVASGYFNLSRDLETSLINLASGRQTNNLKAIAGRLACVDLLCASPQVFLA
ncbi:unnamed protein product [Protopolystoma xenopodis]|uniref:Uncharacterized protein n=1 Tax=Protopolystoma xenopodis TaxID=117903 RepID=A0A3S5BSR5_9PLAT|nr:unnamed protein product [Protopolystoma xenopodis]